MKYKYYLKENTNLTLARFSSQRYLPSFIGIAEEERSIDIDVFDDNEIQSKENSWINLSKFHKVPEEMSLYDYAMENLKWLVLMHHYTHILIIQT